MLESVYSVIALVFVLVACVELCDAATVVDVYRLIQYDLAGVPFGSRLANLNHHAASGFAPAADLSRTVVIVPVRNVNISFIGGSGSIGVCVFFRGSFLFSSLVSCGEVNEVSLSTIISSPYLHFLSRLIVTKNLSFVTSWVLITILIGSTFQNLQLQIDTHIHWEKY